MIDIIEMKDGEDLVLRNSDIRKAGNILSTQIGALDFEPNFGIDLAYFLTSDIQFQNESVKAYMVRCLAERQINVVEVITTIEQFWETNIFTMGNPDDETRGLIR